MKRLVLASLPLLAFNASPLPAGPQKQNFALSFDGGVFSEPNRGLFDNASALVGAGLEYYLFDQIGMGAQFNFSTRDNFGSPVGIGIGTIGASGQRSSNDWLQTLLYFRLAERHSSALKFFILAGPTFNRVTNRSGRRISFGDVHTLEDRATVVGGKLGTGLFIRLKNETHLNFMFAGDSKPQILFSAQAGLTFFFNPFHKNDPTTRP
jgi:hypothetical protein